MRRFLHLQGDGAFFVALFPIKVGACGGGKDLGRDRSFFPFSNTTLFPKPFSGTFQV
jgi:hypothetical protein